MALEAAPPLLSSPIVILSQFYTRTEIATRIAFLYTGNILATGKYRTCTELQ